MVTVGAAEFHHAMVHPSSDRGFVGVDRGLSSYLVAATADGTEVSRVEGLAPLERSLTSLRSACRHQSRCKPHSKNRRKANAKVALIHAQVADQRHDFLHRVTSTLVKTHDHLCLEDLAVANLIKNRHLSRRIADATWGRFAQLVTYKSAWYGTELVTAPRFFPSTKACSACGWVWKEMGLSDRVFLCQACGLVLDRDTNAAVNLAAWANAESSSASQGPDPEARGRVINACGGNGTGRCSSSGATDPATDRSHPARKLEPARVST
jgi:putative transposase